MTYSINIRQLVLKKHSEGSTIRGLTKEFEISPQTIQAWKKNIEPKTYKRKPRKIDNELRRKDYERGVFWRLSIVSRVQDVRSKKSLSMIFYDASSGEPHFINDKIHSSLLKQTDIPYCGYHLIVLI